MRRKPSRPTWWKNTYYWIAIALMIAALAGIVGGPELIRDPGQTDEPYLQWIYVAGAVVMFVNGMLSHRQYVQQYEEEHGTAE